MAIFPITNYYVVNYDVLVSSSFKSGMALMRDSNGYAIKADRSLFNSNGTGEQFGRFIGFASGDHDTLNNIILSDPVGSNYLDSNNVFRDNVNSHYGAFKRSIAEFSDENVNRYYNIFDNSLLSKRGVAVFNLEGESYITDQFAKVESLFIDSDGTDLISFNPGDFLTFGAGINAGKLVKVDSSEIGPSVLIVGVVEKFDSGTNLLYFRHIIKTIKNPVPILTNLIFSLDASNPASYSGSGNTWYDLSGNGLDAQLQNGVLWADENGGTMTFDGTNDQAVVLDNPLLDLPADFTIEGALIKQVGGGGWIHRRSNDSERNWVLAAFNDSFWFLIRYSGAWYPGALNLWGGENLLTKYNHVVVTRNSGVIDCYYNANLRFTFSNSFNLDTSTGFVIGSWDSYGLWSKLKTPYVRLYSQGMTAEQVRQNYNASMGKLL
jgi:hypothetical protein